MLASTPTGEEHTRPTPRGCDLIKGIITLSELVTVNYLCYDKTHYCDIPHCIANVSLCILHGPFYGARHYQHVSSDIRFSHALLEGVSVYAATGVCEHFLLLSVHSRKHVLRKSKSSLRKMDNKVLKRRRPKGAEQTVIGLPAKWKCSPRKIFSKKPKVRKNIWSAVNLELYIIWIILYVKVKVIFYIVQYPVFKIYQSSLSFTGRPV
jgi:hypothetical protein